MSDPKPKRKPTKRQVERLATAQAEAMLRRRPTFAERLVTT